MDSIRKNKKKKLTYVTTQVIEFDLKNNFITDVTNWNLVFDVNRDSLNCKSNENHFNIVNSKIQI